MELKEAIALIQNEHLLNFKDPSVWADLGCGPGLFTKALCHYLKPGSLIYAVDKVNHLELEVTSENIGIVPLQADFEAESLPIGKLNGILMANSLHYVKDKHSFLTECKQAFSNETFLVIEYDTDIPVAQWVPYPISFPSLIALFHDAGFSEITKFAERPSSYGRNTLYAALIRKDV